MEFLTESQRAKRKRNEKIYKDWLRLSATPTNQKMPIYQWLMKKYNLKSPSSIIDIIQKQEKLCMSEVVD
jgi:hypothetical protein